MQAATAAAGRSSTAQQLLQQKVRTADSAAVSSLWRNFRKCDREASGKLSSSEFAAALQSSQLGLSSAEVLQVANGLADSNGLLDYRPVGHMLRSRGSAAPSLQPSPPSCAGGSAKKPPLPRPSSSTALRSVGPDQREGHVAQMSAQSATPAALSAVQTPQPGSAVGSGHCLTTRGMSEPVKNEVAQQQAAQPAACAALQRTPSRAAFDAGRAATDSCAQTGLELTALQRSQRPGTAPYKRAPGPSAQKVPYFFSKGQINMQQPYEWKPSRDNTTIQDAAFKGMYERSWRAGHTGNKPLQVRRNSKTSEKKASLPHFTALL